MNTKARARSGKKGNKGGVTWHRISEKRVREKRKSLGGGAKKRQKRIELRVDKPGGKGPGETIGRNRPKKRERRSIPKAH